MKNIFLYFLLVLVIIITSVLIIMYIFIPDFKQDWFGVAAGLFAIFAILSLSTEYFNPPKKGDLVKAPNKASKVIAGIIGILSGTLWIVSALPVWY